MTRGARFLVSILVGCITAIAIAYVGFTAMRNLWPAYAAAAPYKNYTLTMLLARLALGAMCTVVAAYVTTIIAADRRAAWALGTLFLVVSFPSHRYYSWSDYPVWYHFFIYPASYPSQD